MVKVMFFRAKEFIKKNNGKFATYEFIIAKFLFKRIMKVVIFIGFVMG
jgi:hypothetical protein